MAGIRFLILAVAATALAVAFFAPTASASQLIARDATNVRLQVDAGGKALVTYRVQGRTRHVLAWGAVNAIHATQLRRQVAFRVDYSGGWQTFGRSLQNGFRNVCKPAKVEVAWLVAACRAPDGSYWALQSWQRGLRNYGMPATGTRDDWELRLSHWTGAVPTLDVGIGWAYRKFHSLFGRYTWRGRGIHGFASTPAGVPLDSFGRNLYVDTLNSAYGAGWQRENGFLSHVGTRRVLLRLLSARLASVRHGRALPHQRERAGGPPRCVLGRSTAHDLRPRFRRRSRQAPGRAPRAGPALPAEVSDA